MQEGLSPDQFAEVFEATKKIIDILSCRQPDASLCETECDPQVVVFLKKCRLAQYARKFSRYCIIPYRLHPSILQILDDIFARAVSSRLHRHLGHNARYPTIQLTAQMVR